MSYSLSALSLLLCLASLSSTVTGAVTLVTDYDDFACPNTNALITCTTDTGQLVWNIAAGSNQAYNTISNLNQAHSVGNFTVRLISKSGNTLTSTAVINATGPRNGSSIDCADSFSGGMTDTAVVLLATIPSQPLNLINATTTHDTIVLNWTVPLSLGGVPIDQYSVTISPALQSSCPGQCVTNTESLTITNLQYGLTYTITVTAGNCAGMGPPQTLNVTITATEPNPPINFEVCMSSNQEVRVTWTCPSSMNILSPPIANYTVTFTSPGLQTDTQYVSHVGCNCPYTLTRTLQSGSHLYTVSVTATNSVGDSTNNPSASIYTTPNITADSPLVTTTMAVMSINMSWAVCKGILAQFEVGYSLDSQTDSSSISVTLPLIDTLFVPLTGLSSNSFYRSEVQLTVGRDFPAIDGPSFTTIKELTPNQCSSLIYTVTETASVTPANTAGTSQQCENESNLYLGIGVLASVAAIAIIAVILVACVLIVKLRNKKNSIPTADNDLRRVKSDSYSHLNSFTNSQSQLLSSSPMPTGVAPVSPWNTMTMMTPNDSYGHRPPQPLPNEGGPSEYAEIPSYHMPPDITNNPTYTQVDLNQAEPVKSNGNGEYTPSDSERMSPPPSEQVNNPAYGTAATPAPYLKPVNRYAESPIADGPCDEYI